MFGEINISCNPLSEVLRHYKGILHTEKGGKEYRLLKLAKDPVATSDAPGAT